MDHTSAKGIVPASNMHREEHPPKARPDATIHQAPIDANHARGPVVSMILGIHVGKNIMFTRL